MFPAPENHGLMKKEVLKFLMVQCLLFTRTWHFRNVFYVYCIFPAFVAELLLPSVQLCAVALFACCGQFLVLLLLGG